MRIRYNAPVVLSFALISTLVLMLDTFLHFGLTAQYFVLYPRFAAGSALSYLRLFTHVIGHKDWAHLIGNFSFILLIGPILEEKYRSGSILIMMLATALATGLLNLLFFSTALMGASGVVFMLILLSSFTNIRSGEIPLTFILILVLYLAREVIGGLGADNISQFAHIIGGICGSLFGFLLTRSKRTSGG